MQCSMHRRKVLNFAGFFENGTPAFLKRTVVSVNKLKDVQETIWKEGEEEGRFAKGNWASPRWVVFKGGWPCIAVRWKGDVLSRDRPPPPSSLPRPALFLGALVILLPAVLPFNCHYVKSTC